jgi:hypothetical protein
LIAFRYKNFKCDIHDKFFEVNLYQKDPINRHHWRATLARPSDDIDLPRQHATIVEDDRQKKLFEPQGVPLSSGGHRSGGFISSSSMPLVKTCLSLVIPPLLRSFNGGDLVSLISLDQLISHLDITVDTSETWHDRLNPTDIVQFILHCARDHKVMDGMAHQLNFMIY